MNMVQIMYRHVCKSKKIPVEMVPRMRGGALKDSTAEGEFKYDIFDTLLEPL
jgi:hypothetical protein